MQHSVYDDFRLALVFLDLREEPASYGKSIGLYVEAVNEESCENIRSVNRTRSGTVLVKITATLYYYMTADGLFSCCLPPNGRQITK